MHKELYIYIEGKPVHAVIRNYSKADFDALIDVQRQSFPPPFPEELWWNEDQLLQHITRFPEGALCIEADGVIIGSMTGLIVQMSDYEHSHNWEIVTGNGYITNHNPNGDTLYVVDICVVPDYRKTGAAAWLMQSMYETVVQLGLLRLLGGGRMPGYAAKQAEASPQQYVDNVVKGIWKDPVISFLLKCGRLPVGVAEHYLEDAQSCNCAAIMEWRNPFVK